MNRLSTKERTRVIACSAQGNSQRATVRMTGIAKKTVARLAVEIGEACERFTDNIMRDLPCTQIQCDEIWSFCHAKAKNVPKHLKGSGAGDVWTWVAIYLETKLIPAWYVGDRTAQSAYPFMRNVAKRLKNRVKLSTDGHRAYLIAVKAAFHLQEIDFGMLRKIYGENTLEANIAPASALAQSARSLAGKSRKAKSAQAMLSARISRCVCRCGVLHRLTNAFSKRSIITASRALCISFITTFVASTVRCE